jgi:hypothetical protein
LYSTPSNQARLAWLLNAVGDNERVVDIGPGSGSIAGRIIRTKKPQRYAAIEPSDGKIRWFHSMADENGIAPTDYELHRATAEQAAATVIADVQPTLVLLLEVLEHVGDPGQLIQAAAATMPDECDLLISVPIVGRIEHEWGHLSVFDRPRLERLAAESGLLIHWVQPIADLWLFVLLSKSPTPRPRLARLSADLSARSREAAVADASYQFRRVTVPAESAIVASGPRKSTHVAIHTGEISVLRIRVDADHSSLPGSVTVDFTSRDEPVERWELADSDLRKAAQGPATWVFRRGAAHGRRHHDLVPGARPDGFAIRVQAGAFRPAKIELERAEVVAWVSEPVVSISIPTVGSAWQPRRLAAGARRRLRRLLANWPQT